jgi:beta-glucosidase
MSYLKFLFLISFSIKIQAMKTFPQEFLWGTASSAYQTEGNNIHNDWYIYEQSEAQKPEKERKLAGMCGGATLQWQYYEQDYDLAQKMGVKIHRLSIEWSRIFPSAGKPNLEALEIYRKQLLALHQRGIKTMVCLHHFTIPVWVLQRGGFLHSRYVLTHFQKYLELVIPYLADEVDYWLPINEPNIVPSASYLIGMFPPFKKNLFQYLRVYRLMIEMHAAAYHVIKKNNKKAQVGVAFAYMHFQPFNPSNRWQQFLSDLSDKWANKIFFDAVIGGKWAFPLGWGGSAPHVKGTLDFIGLNYYTTLYLKNFGLVPVKKGDVVTDMGWVVYPEGIRSVLQKLHNISSKPIIVTENGTATTDESFRINYYKRHLLEIHQAIEAGIPVLGYMAWSLTDNYEWQHAYSKKFGLISIEPQTYRRKIKESGRWYQRVIEKNGF